MGPPRQRLSGDHPSRAANDTGRFSTSNTTGPWLCVRPVEVCLMPESFGARLRMRREERQIALTSIAEETKIKLALLEGLERDDVSHWPSGIFRRAYLRAY